MVMEGRLRQKKLQNQLKLEAKLHDLEVEWCGGSDTREEILARIHQREEAAVKRERAMAYAFSHQWVFLVADEVSLPGEEAKEGDEDDGDTAQGRKKRYTPHPTEVEAVFGAPLAMFIKDENQRVEERMDGRKVSGSFL
ncbi:hypothetical protein GH714_015791 [Hevea brasiliensis]|uniref:Uncharacterized protein n=1 Tax=Hevea brasiliensis TaxID=3981 RepID=A0A6A6LT63_HEVBR|nr:hypothetical protein GH714_015791 [Hevea brasiliensis]